MRSAFLIQICARSRTSSPVYTSLSHLRAPLTSTKRPLTNSAIDQIRKMSSQGFSNTDVGSKPADPYKEKNLDRDATTKEKIEDLAAFEKNTKFGMMTTRDGKTGNLVSRCMAIAAQVCPRPPRSAAAVADTPHRRQAVSTYSSTPTPSQARRTSYKPTHTSTSRS
jgi:hypothetical protein